MSSGRSFMENFLKAYNIKTAPALFSGKGVSAWQV